jgi:hypothetical protein
VSQRKRKVLYGVQVPIDGDVWDVQVVDTLSGDFGYCQPGKQRIRLALDKRSPDDPLDSTLLHEIIHAIVPQLTEYTVRQIESTYAEAREKLRRAMDRNPK